MGLNLLSYLKKNTTKTQWLAFFGTFVCTLLVHLYHFANGLPGRDSFLNYYADQNILGSGRWALSVACGISSYYDLPWVIGINACLFLALAAVAVVSVLEIKNPVLILITGALMASTPTVTETFVFLYTADGYMIAMALAAFAVWFSRIEETRPGRWILSAVCICIACGIYQAYVSLSLILAVCYFMLELMRNRYEKKEYFRWIVRQIIVFAAALAAYYLIWQLCMKVQNITPNDYQGIADVGTVSADLLVKGLISSIRTFKWYFAPWSVATYGLTPYITLNFVFVLFFGISLLLAVWKSEIWKRPWALCLMALCLAAIIPFSSIWHFTSDSVFYRAMMLPGMVVLFVFAALNLEHWGKQTMQNLFGCLMIAVIVNNMVMANIVYFHMNLCYERTYAQAVAMMDDIREQQERHNVDQYTVVGQRYTETMLRGNDPEFGTTNEIGQIQLFTGILDENLLIEGGRISAFLEQIFGQEMEYHEKAVSLEDPEVQMMPTWPQAGSVKVIDDMLVIKLSENPE